MAKILYIPITGLIIFLAYTIYSQDLKISEFRENDQKQIVTIYTEADCPYCINAKKFLDDKKIKYTNIDITWDKELRQKLSQETEQSTVPYIFINGILIGGYDDLVKLDKSKKLNSMLKECNNKE